MAEIIDNVTFLYTKIQKPVFKYGSTTDSEWSVDCVVSKAAAKAWKKSFPKNKVKEFDNDEFVEKFGIDAPFPEQDEQFILKIKKDCKKTMPDGNVFETPEKYRPRTIEQTAAGRADVTFEKLVGNGSKGKVSYTIRDVKDEQFPQLSAILVEEMVEHVSKGGAAAGEEFGASPKAVPAGNDKKPVVKQGDEESFDDLPPAASKPVKAKATPKAPVDESLDCPF